MQTDAQIRFPHSSLDEFREVGDALGDNLLVALVELGYDNGKHNLLDFLQEHGDKPEVAAFLQSIYTVPDWVDFERIANGRLVYLRHAPLAMMVLFLAGLIGSYTAEKGIKVLVKTGRLQQDILPRLLETSAMVADVLQPNALKADGKGFSTLVKVRLMHCGVRRFILNHPEPWNEEWGFPINQEDMCGTLTLFSYVVLKGLEKLGIYIPEEDKEDYIHLWRYAGYLLGCDDFFLPESYSETEKLYEIVRARQTNPDNDSRALVHGVIEAVSNVDGRSLPKEALYELSRFFIGDELSDSLAMPQNYFWKLMFNNVSPFWSVSSFAFAQTGPLYKFLTPWVGNQFIQGRLSASMNGKGVHYYIPGLR